MSALTDFTENKFIDQVFRNRQWTVPAGIFVCLYTAAPGEAGGGTEVAGGSYVPVQHGPSDTTWEATQGGTPAAASSGSSGATQNAGVITFAAPTANWGNITHAALKDASAGNMLIYGALAAAKTVNNLDPAPTFPAGALDFSIA